MKVKVFLVDDEFLQRELVKKVIDWKTLGMEIIGEAEDGEEALEKVRELHPDILVMDINIPYIDGIEVSKRIKEKLPDTQIIILTAYGEFEYAKEAISLGAVSFVLKPVNPEELTCELEKCGKNLENIWRQRKSLQKMQKKIDRKEREQFLLEQISGIGTPKEEEQIFSILGFSGKSEFAMLIIRPEGRDKKKNIAEEIEEMIQDYFQEYEVVAMNQATLFVLFKDTEMEYQLRLLCTYLQDNMNQNGEFSGGVSRVHSRKKGLREAYQEAYAAGKKGLCERRIVIYEPVNIGDFLRAVAYDPQRLLVHLRKGEYAEFQKNVRFFFGKMERENILPQAAYYVAMDIMVHFSLYMSELGVDFSGRAEVNQRVLLELFESGRVPEMEQNLLAFLEEGCVLIERYKMPSTRKKVQDAKKFIDENFGRFDMSLNLVAEEIKVNASYLSNIFKKECGCSLSKYITSVRLETAKKWMNTWPEKTLMEISEAVGYGDVYYFSKNFKNYFGITPSKYQEEKG